jgi:hypothetical protein
VLLLSLLIDVPSQSARVQSGERVKFLFTAARRQQWEGGRPREKIGREVRAQTEE